jgi:hypothetical protein
MAKTRVIGIKVADESDLPERLKALSQQTRLEYHELLEKWIGQEETEFAGKPAFYVPKPAMENVLNFTKVEKFMKLISDKFNCVWDDEKQDWQFPNKKPASVKIEPCEDQPAIEQTEPNRETAKEAPIEQPANEQLQDKKEPVKPETIAPKKYHESTVIEQPKPALTDDMAARQFQKAYDKINTDTGDYRSVKLKDLRIVLGWSREEFRRLVLKWRDENKLELALVNPPAYGIDEIKADEEYFIREDFGHGDTNIWTTVKFVQVATSQDKVSEQEDEIEPALPSDTKAVTVKDLSREEKKLLADKVRELNGKGITYKDIAEAFNEAREGGIDNWNKDRVINLQRANK